MVLVIITVVVFFSMGYRFVSTDEGYRFFGKASGGQEMTGTIRYPNGDTAALDFAAGKIVFANGDIYEGGISGIYRNGKGKMTYAATGDVYEGDFLNDEITGLGVYTYANGDVYEGSLMNGK